MAEKLIIFDCFGVIFEDIAPAFMRRYLDEERAPVVKEELFPPADLGKITYDELLDNMAKSLELDRGEMVEEWNAMFKPRKTILPVVKALGEKHGITDLFKKMFISCNIGLAKPDKEIYLYCVNEMGKNYDKIYMIDDNWGNLEHLSEIGIKPVHYKGDDSVLEALM